MPTSARSIIFRVSSSRPSRSYYQAFRLSHDPQQRMRTLGDVAIGLREIGALDAARVAFQIVIDSSASMHVRTNSILELMDLEAAGGNRVAFERCRAAAEACASRMSPSMSVDYHYKLGIGLGRFEQRGRARDALTAALAMAETPRAERLVLQDRAGTRGARPNTPSRSLVDQGRVTSERGTCDTANGSGSAGVRRVRSPLVAACVGRHPARGWIALVVGARSSSKDACGCSDGPVVSVRVQAVLRAAEASRVRTRP